MTRRTTGLLATLTAFCTAGILLPGCVKRTETIRVQPDGTAQVTLVFEGDPDDIHDGDAMLEDPGPWTVKDELETNENDDDELTRTATLTVPVGGDFPEHYAGDDLELAPLALQMTTSLQMERRPDGTYYHFKRRYHARNWAYVDYYRRAIVEESVDDLQDKNFAELTGGEKHNVARALRDFEAAKSRAIALAAADALDPPLRQDDWLAIDRGISEAYDQISVDKVVDLLELEGDQAGAEMERVARQNNDRIEQTINQVLNRQDPTGRLASTFADQFRRERRSHTISEDLQDEAFEVVVQLPGRIIGHNSPEEQSEKNSIKWEFEGKALYDRDEVLMATSVVEPD